MSDSRGESDHHHDEKATSSSLPSPSHQSSSELKAATSNTEIVTDKPISKNQLKKQRKRQRFLEKKMERKKKEKEAKRAKAEAEGRDLDEEERLRQISTELGRTKRRRQERWDTEKLPHAKNSFQIVLDCSYESQMTEKEIYSLAKQIRYCYSYNKNSTKPCLWTVTSLTGLTKEQLEKEAGYNEWVNRAYTATEEALEEYFNNKNNNNTSSFTYPNDIIYLTSDSDNVIMELDYTKIYVIGGIVDRNRLKNATIQRAQKLGIQTAKLPLDNYLKSMPTTKVLTCNHVFHILLKYKEYNNNWIKAMQDVLPIRKEAEFVINNNNNDNTQEEISNNKNNNTSEEEEEEQNCNKSEADIDK